MIFGHLRFEYCLFSFKLPRLRIVRQRFRYPARRIVVWNQNLSPTSTTLYLGFDSVSLCRRRINFIALKIQNVAFISKLNVIYVELLLECPHITFIDIVNSVLNRCLDFIKFRSKLSLEAI